MIKYEIESHYCPDSDITFITENCILGGGESKLTVVSYYFGEPHLEDTLQFYHQAKFKQNSSNIVNNF